MPNGGYTAACVLAAASTHLSSRGQPDNLTAPFEYPSRTSAGPAIVVIEDVKLGAQLSTLHLTLWQGGLLPKAPWITPSVSRRCVLAYTNQTKLSSFDGPSVPTGFEATAAAEFPALPDFDALKAKGSDHIWEEPKTGGPNSIWRARENWRFYTPRGEPQTSGSLDMWVRLASGEPITQSALPYLVDSFPANMITFLAAPVVRKMFLAPPDPPGDKGGTQSEGPPEMWLPTVVMNLEQKVMLPEEGVEWLAVRVTTKLIRDGKFDMEVVVRDTDGELVVLSHHTAMILSVERNTAKRSSKPKASL